ncbi:protocatechuate 3,4-dioxygenase subunit beta [Caballeronia choica]|jgi:protocatechuate 3,4-dioxygenase beta subunit|uniref:Protocatechuate 3,4-dioxygenase subunit beta n=1 Tax=Caballeronia choica TaxID=326476 RepID=A0A158KQM3_9BURK|nr:intradiol ring-cleavage dioxygenase [Caballeronia choica]SAL83295.1 protocatechuate 3,4-dioxygenase subunit beta [Caballeronia choica]
MRARSVSWGRRDFLRRSGAVPSTLLLLALGRADEGRADAVSPTPACDDGHGSTPRQTAGPFFLPHSPQRTSLIETGISGPKIVLTGQVLSTRCRAVSGALLDFWHANDAGDYDVEGFRLRGHQFADSEGRYRLETIVPGPYPGRTRHFHVTVQAPNGSPLTTQLYFPGEQRNARDFLFDRRLLMTIDDQDGRKAARFDFVLPFA